MNTLTIADLAALFDALSRRGYETIAPVLRDGAIEPEPVRSVDALPAGWGDEQAPGKYRVTRRDDGALFGFAVGARSFRHLFQPPRERLYTIRKKGASLDVAPADVQARRLALVGARACDLAAIAVHDRVLGATDPGYAARRADVFVVAVACGSPSSSCFCTSMGGGPDPTTGFDVSLTEVLHGEHRFVARAGSERGAQLLGELTTREATVGDESAAADVVRAARARIERRLDTRGLPALLQASPEHPRWAEIGDRCVSCTSCTLVCPTCFCTATEDTGAIGDDEATRDRRWDSCFSPEHSHMHGGSVRSTARSRYRQWLTHKLSTWIDQFGMSGCVGCGRCITWCPAGIDLTAEVASLSRGQA